MTPAGTTSAPIRAAARGSAIRRQTSTGREEGATFTDWYGQASCTAGRASFLTGRLPIRSALSIVVAPGDPNFLRKETPTIAKFFKKNGYSTYFSGKWHMGDKAGIRWIEHGFDEMKNFAAYYAGVYAYDDTSKWSHPWFPSFNPQFQKYFSENVKTPEGLFANRRHCFRRREARRRRGGQAGLPDPSLAFGADYIRNFDRVTREDPNT